MKVGLTKKLGFALVIFGFFAFPATRSQGAVIVFDNVTTVGTPVYLKVLTKGRLFAAGGRLVQFYLDNQSFGKNLTGGDGYGYRKYTPTRAGMIKIRATSNLEGGTGLLLVMNKSEKAVLIEIEGGLKDAFISGIAAGASRRAVDQLLQKYRVIYLSRWTGIQGARVLIDKVELPEAPVLQWQGVKTLSALEANGVNLYAIIGAAGVITEAAGYIEKRYTFDPSRGGQAAMGETVKDWEEILKSLSQSASAGSAKNKAK
jgi:hypothetical protein